LGVAAHVLTSDDTVNGSDAARQVEVAKTIKLAANAAPNVTAPGPQPAIRPATTVTHAEPPFSPSAPVVVTLTPRPNDPALAPPRMVMIPKDRDSLARELQKELRRVGCYEGEVNGVWTPATRRAMKTFTDRVNATLPVDEPDAVLFAMVLGQQDRVCGKPCPADQGLSEDGRCLPNAILAKAARKPSPAVAGYVPVGGPAAAKPAPAITGWSTTVTAPPRPSSPATATAPVPPPALASTAVPAASASPASEGRMALAGPPAPETPGSPEAAGQAVTPRPALPTPPKRVVQGGGGWVRVMNVRRFDSPN
jgi:hypothetical protein